MATQNSVNDIYLPLAGGTMTGNVVTLTSTDTVTTVASSGASYTINLATADEFNITLTANCTFSFSNILGSNLTRFVVTLVQDGTGSRTVTWPGSVTWVSGLAPVLNTAAAAFDTLVFQTYNGGTNVYGYTTGTETIQTYSLIENNGTSLTQRTTLNFAATGLVATDNGGSARTDVTLASGISGWNGFASSGMLAETATNTYAARTITGTANQIAVTNGTGVSGNPTIAIDAAYVGQTSITTLGTVTTGTYSAVVQDYTETNTAASTGTSYAISLANGNVFSLTLTGNCTFTITNVPASNASSITVFLIQDGTGSRTVTWPASVIWPGGTVPTLTTTANHVDVITLITTNAGTTWRAFAAGLNFTS